ncbi:glucosyl-3-phosphoglycerate/mannosyl-3-phosphoglycerate phosphatase [bacterium BMS3Abin07]|nr:glucosyl-3-phosphoglycerate/mannosyl-3-phosphoglycerate phosphatase [bacterium BMS3Abin07]GBE32001.1 glucosyl-3-phosphoglycerate/mannosyl-3-phosphoglycerate phosphatase [bacterium BMS3Bbin05]HDO21421.1 HAD-IIB family hydrolase [Nitrospirota bacterium]HDZ88283.1 HAD-IIB family hydrolase [Nitrospirota bacterium]
MKKIIIFTDLDGTLLEEDTYSFEPAREALEVIREKQIPLVIVSSKTAGEIIYYRKLLDNGHPFVSENGGGIFIPAGYVREMPFWIRTSKKYGYDMISLGAPYKDLIDALHKLRLMGFNIKGFSDMNIDEIMHVTGLSRDQAKMSKERDYDEPIIVDDTVNLNSLKQAIRDMGLHYTSGRFIHLIGDNDKGRAVRMIRDIYKVNYGEVITVALGDNLNDIPMFMNVDHPVVVKKKNGSHDIEILEAVPNIKPSNGMGPEGFNQSVIKIIGDLSENRE